MDTAAIWVILAAAAISLMVLWGAARMARRRQLIDGLPTCKTSGVFIGLVEVRGTAESEAPLTSHLAGVHCVQHSWSVQEHWSRTVIETYTDSKGRTKTRQRRESGWKTVDQGGGAIPFYLRDDCGVLLIRPDEAGIEPLTVFNETCGRGEALYYAKGPPHAVANSDHRRQFVEHAIPLHTEVYVIGRAREREDIVAAEIAHDSEAPLFLISTRKEAEISRGYRWKYWLLVVLGLLIAAIAPGAILQEAAFRRGLPAFLPFVAGSALYLVAALVAWAWTVYNGLMDLRNRVAAAWSQVDVQLKRRFDLIPRLEATVKGLQSHERIVQEELADLRSQRDATPPGESGPDFHALGRRLIALKESYPELTANTGFLELQSQLADTEQRIALARGYYNEIATHFNTRIEVFPDRFMASRANLKARSLMAANEFERAPVKVQLVD
jgi:hypothetical protein